MTTTAHEDQFTPGTQTIERVRQPYDTASILRRNVADLELALRTQTELKEKAEAELAQARQQKPLTWGTSGELMDILKNPIYSSPAPVPAPAVPEAWRNFVMQVATPPAVYLDYPKIGAQEPPVKCRHWRCRSCMCAWSLYDNEQHAENCRYVQARALLQSAPTGEPK